MRQSRHATPDESSVEVFIGTAIDAKDSDGLGGGRIVATVHFKVGSRDFRNFGHG